MTLCGLFRWVCSGIPALKINSSAGSSFFFFISHLTRFHFIRNRLRCFYRPSHLTPLIIADSQQWRLFFWEFIWIIHTGVEVYRSPPYGWTAAACFSQQFWIFSSPNFAPRRCCEVRRWTRAGVCCFWWRGMCRHDRLHWTSSMFRGTSSCRPIPDHHRKDSSRSGFDPVFHLTHFIIWERFRFTVQTGYYLMVPLRSLTGLTGYFGTSRNSGDSAAILINEALVMGIFFHSLFSDP